MLDCKILRIRNVMRSHFYYKCEKLISINSYGFSDFLPAGDITGYKKLKNGHIAQLLIPANAKRVGRRSRKCRAEYAQVLKIWDPKTGENVNVGHSYRSSYFTYYVGDTVVASNFDDDPDKVCAGGIHFFLTEQEAIDYDYN